MFYAIDQDGKRISAENADKDIGYRCPYCMDSVTLKHGAIKLPHFAHKNTKDCDVLENKMTLWHLGFQTRFPNDEREVIINGKGEKHIADVCHNGLVIEFQHSPISFDEFVERTAFYVENCRGLIWVFDVRDKDIKDYYVPKWYPSQEYRLRRTQYNIPYVWKHANKLLGGFDMHSINRLPKRFELFLHLPNGDLLRVNWNKQGIKYFSGVEWSVDRFVDFVTYRTDCFNDGSSFDLAGYLRKSMEQFIRDGREIYDYIIPDSEPQAE